MSSSVLYPASAARMEHREHAPAAVAFTVVNVRRKPTATGVSRSSRSFRKAGGGAAEGAAEGGGVAEGAEEEAEEWGGEWGGLGPGTNARNRIQQGGGYINCG